MLRFLSLFAVICVLFAAPYVFFQIRINEAFLGGAEAGAWNILRYAKFIIYGLMAPGVIVGLWFFVGKGRLFHCGIATLLYVLALLAVTNYYDYFGIVPHWNQLRNLDQLTMVGGQIKSQLLGWEDGLMLLTPLAGFGGMAVFLEKPRRKWLRFSPLALGMVAFALLGLQLVRHPFLPTLNAYGYTMGCSHFGITPTYAVMLADFIPREPREVAFPRERVQNVASEFTGRLHGSNVIVLQVESLDADLINRRVGRELVMPFLTKLANESVYFPKCVAMHAGGGSSDAELAALLSLVPLTSGSGFTKADWDRVTPVSRVLNAADYTCVALHANRGSFYERSQRYAEMEFAAFHDHKQFSGAATGWYSKDAAFFAQSIAKLSALPEPFFGYFITMQSHGPFQNYDAATRQNLAGALNSLNTEEADYLCSFREVDAALSILFRELTAAGLLETTLVVIHGDHESGLGTKMDRPGERVPLLFCHPMLAAEKSSRLVSQVDIAPTVIDLLGLKKAPSWLGRSVFSRDDREQIVLPTGVAIMKNSSERNDAAFRTIDYSRALLGE